MVFGLDAIVPLEFLLPTFRVAKELEWTRHELSHRVEELDHLNEIRLIAIARVYALVSRFLYS